MFRKTLYLIIFCDINKFCLSHSSPEADTPLGKVRGYWKTSFEGRKYAAFEGIPYAKSPTGHLRFEEPQPVDPWTDVLNATQPRTCLQPSFSHSGEIEGDEDCLHLNIFVPAKDVDSKKDYDVLVIIHGGAFTFGSGHTMMDSKILMDRDLIVVSINYRLGILGFLSTEDDAIPGNNGMKDQVLALKWVKDNIASFGGKADSVTITGLSAGGASVHLHYLSPLSKGLFARGLSQSGTALNPWVIQKNPLEKAKMLAVLLDCSSASTYLLKQCFRKKPATAIVEKLKYFYGYDIMPFSPFAPVIEKGSTNEFLAKDPYLLLKEKNVLDLPWITSTTATEGLLPAATYFTLLEDVENNWTEIAHYLFDYNCTLPVSKRKEVAKNIKEYYLGPNEQINEKNFNKFTQIFTDRLFAIGSEKAAKLQSRANKSPVYYYYFNYKEGENKAVFLFSKGKELEGVAHGEDSLYFYGFLLKERLSEKDLKMKNVCQDMIYSYVTTGKPSSDRTDKWQPTTDYALTYLNITNPEYIELERRDHLTPSEFWDNLGLLEDENLVVKDEL